LVSYLFEHGPQIAQLESCFRTHGLSLGFELFSHALDEAPCEIVFDFLNLLDMLKVIGALDEVNVAANIFKALSACFIIQIIMCLLLHRILAHKINNAKSYIFS